VQTRYSRANTMRSTICRDYVHFLMEEAARYHDGGMIVGIVKTALMTLRRRRGDEDLLCGVLKRNSKPNEAVESNLIFSSFLHVFTPPFTLCAPALGGVSTPLLAAGHNILRFVKKFSCR